VAGVPLASPWVSSGNSMSLSIGGRQYTDGRGLAQDTTRAARDALGKIVAVMPALKSGVETIVDGINPRPAS
jgi:hypothetical protein